MRMRASETIAIATSPRALAGATRVSQRASPPSLTGRPRLSVTETRRVAAPWRLRRDGADLLSGSTGIGVVRLYDLLHQRVAHDVLLVETDEIDTIDVADHFHGFNQPGCASGGQVDLGDVAGDHRLGTESKTR